MKKEQIGTIDRSTPPETAGAPTGAGSVPFEKIDMYSHILPGEYKDAILDRTPKTSYYYEADSKRPALWDLDTRFRAMDNIGGLRQVICPGAPPVEYVAKQKDAVDLARRCNDAMAELVARYPDRFPAGVACLPMEDIDASLLEAERAVRDLNLKGVQVFTSVNGRPLNHPGFLPLYGMMAAFDLPIWIHPVRDRQVPDYPGESISEYGLFLAFSWPYETTIAMGRLVFSGVLERFPALKLITHHCGGMLPSFYKRAALIPPGVKTGDVTKLERPPEEYFRRFYADTVMGGNVPALMTGYAFFGADRLLFATDYPYPGGATQSEAAMRGVIKSVEAMDITDEEKARIFSENAKTLLKLA